MSGPKEVETSPNGRYIRFDKRLGKGAYKDVWLAYDSETGKEVAWNTVDMARMPANEKDRISLETGILSSLKHRNIINFYHVWENPAKEEICFTTEIVSSGTLKEYIQRVKKVKLKVIKDWCRQILTGLDYLHTRTPAPIIHRDLKCDNIFINGSTGEIRIGDFGLSATKYASHAKSVLGTPEFMAPELYDESYTEKVDIYAFGMCFLEMISHEYPYEECSNAAQIWKKVTSGKKPQVLERIKDPTVKAFAELCLLPHSIRLSARELLRHPFLVFNCCHVRDFGVVPVDAKPDSKEAEHHAHAHKHEESTKDQKEKQTPKDKHGAIKEADDKQKLKDKEKDKDRDKDPKPQPDHLGDRPVVAATSPVMAVQSITGTPLATSEASEIARTQSPGQGPNNANAVTTANTIASTQSQAQAMAALQQQQPASMPPGPHLQIDIPRSTHLHPGAIPTVPLPAASILSPQGNVVSPVNNSSRGSTPSNSNPSSSINSTLTSNPNNNTLNPNNLVSTAAVSGVGSNNSINSAVSSNSSVNSVNSTSSNTANTNTGPSQITELPTQINIDVEQVVDNIAKVVLHISFEKRRKKQIKFDFNFLSDTASSIATEMVKALKIPDVSQAVFIKLISSSIKSKLESISQSYSPDQMKSPPNDVVYQLTAQPTPSNNTQAMGTPVQLYHFAQQMSTPNTVIYAQQPGPSQPAFVPSSYSIHQHPSIPQQYVYGDNSKMHLDKQHHSHSHSYEYQARSQTMPNALPSQWPQGSQSYHQLPQTAPPNTMHHSQQQQQQQQSYGPHSFHSHSLSAGQSMTLPSGGLQYTTPPQQINHSLPLQQQLHYTQPNQPQQGTSYTSAGIQMLPNQSGQHLPASQPTYSQIVQGPVLVQNQGSSSMRERVTPVLNTSQLPSSGQTLWVAGTQQYPNNNTISYQQQPQHVASFGNNGYPQQWDPNTQNYNSNFPNTNNALSPPSILPPHHPGAPAQQQLGMPEPQRGGGAPPPNFTPRTQSPPLTTPSRSDSPSNSKHSQRNLQSTPSTSSLPTGSSQQSKPFPAASYQTYPTPATPRSDSNVSLPQYPQALPGQGQLLLAGQQLQQPRHDRQSSLSNGSSAIPSSTPHRTSITRPHPVSVPPLGQSQGGGHGAPHSDSSPPSSHSPHSSRSQSPAGTHDDVESPLSRSPPGVASPIASSNSPVLARSSSESPLPYIHSASALPPQSSSSSSTHSTSPIPEDSVVSPESDAQSSGPGLVQDISTKLELAILRERQDLQKKDLEEKVEQMRKELETQIKADTERMQRQLKNRGDRKARGDGHQTLKIQHHHHRHASGSTTLPEPLPPRPRVAMDTARAKTQRTIPTAQLTVSTTPSENSPLALITPPPTPNPELVQSSSAYPSGYESSVSGEGVLHNFAESPVTSDHRTVIDHSAFRSAQTRAAERSEIPKALAPSDGTPAQDARPAKP